MRYTEMKYSGFPDIGEIPAHWPVVRIKHRYSVFCGATPSDNPENWNGDIAWIGPADMSDFGKIKNGKRTISQIGYDSCGTHKLPKGSVILSTRAPIGKIQITEEEVCTNQGCKSMVIRYDKDTSDYLAYFLFSIKERLEVSGTGTTFKELSTINLKNMPLLLPSSSEQATIAAYLDEKCAAIDEIIGQAKATIEEYRAWKASVIFEAVTKGLDPNAKMKDSGIPWLGEIPVEWKTCRIKHLCTMQAGKNITSEDIEENGDYPVYGGNGLRGFYKSFNQEQTCILVGRQGALCGNVHLVSGRFWATDHAIVTIPTEHEKVQYLYYLLLAMNLNQYANETAAQPGLSVSVIQKLQTVQPPYSEQHIIADYLDVKCAKIDTIIAEKQTLIDELETYKKSLIFETVTGKRRVC